MKRMTIFFLIGISLFTLTQMHATVWRVNNNTGIDADFTTLAAATDAASAGDTIYLEGSPNGYGADSIDKKLTIIGTGYFLQANDSTQANFNASSTGTLTIVADSAIIQGISIGLGNSVHGIIIHANHVTIRRCKIVSYGYGGGNVITVGVGYTGIVIRQNFFDIQSNGSLSGQGGVEVLENSVVNIENNFIWKDDLGQNGDQGAIYLHTSASPNCVIRNNVLRGRLYIHNTANFKNNILIDGPIGGNFTGDYNMCNSTQFTGQPNSILNANMNNIFVNNGGGEDNDYKLTCSGGPDDGCGDGEFGHDMGMFGGPSPYKLSGIPDIPAIFQFGGTGSASDNTPLQINIKAKSHN